MFLRTKLGLEEWFCGSQINVRLPWLEARKVRGKLTNLGIVKKGMMREGVCG